MRQTIVKMLRELQNSSLVDDLSVYRKALRKQSGFSKEDTSFLTLDNLITLIEEPERVVEKQEIVRPVLRYFKGQPISEEDTPCASPRGIPCGSSLTKTDEKLNPFIEVLCGIIATYQPNLNINEFEIELLEDETGDICLRGPTRPLKEGLKKIGGVFSSDTKIWTFHNMFRLLHLEKLERKSESTEMRVETNIERDERKVENKFEIKFETKEEYSSASTPRSTVDLGNLKSLNPKKRLRKILNMELGRDVSSQLKLQVDEANGTIKVSMKDTNAPPIQVKPEQIVNINQSMQNLTNPNEVFYFPVWTFGVESSN